MTSAQKYNKKLDSIFENAKQNGAIKTTNKQFNPFLLHKLQTAGGLSLAKADQVCRMVETLGLYI